MSTEVFALDIGTRTIAGLLLTQAGEGYELKQAAVEQQLPGAMADGQIHHIDAVAKTMAKIKAELEAACGTTIEKVAVAAAGRSLLTSWGESSLELQPNQRLTAEEVKALELAAVQDGVGKLAPHSNQGVMESYLCVGYSVVQYYLDGEPIGSLTGHQGTRAKVEVIATFLPRIVIDSLSTALEKAGLEMDSLTLEPIAAMHVVVPPTMRMLNIALVDVGAGTSDLAVAAEGTIRGYGMVSLAGDSITQGLAEHFLLDFRAAEKLKVELKPGQPSECQDVFGNKLTLSYEEVLAVIRPRAAKLAQTIAQELVALNGGAPKGVILIGGGSRVPGLAELLAAELDLPQHLVRVRDRSTLQVVQGVPHFDGPESITPIGIGCTHLDGRSMELIHVTVNDQRLQFLKLKSSTVGEALVQAGLEPQDLVGRPGSAYTVELNGRCIALPGTLGEAAEITKNGEPCQLSSTLADGDRLVVLPGRAGQPPRVTLAEFIDADAQSFSLTLNGQALEVQPQVKVNGESKPLSYVLQDRDQVTLQPISTLGQLLESLNLPLEQELSFFFNGEEQTVFLPLEIRVDGEPSTLAAPLRSGMEVEYSYHPYTLKQLLGAEFKHRPGITVQVNGSQVQLNQKGSKVLVNGEAVSLDYAVKPQDRIEAGPASKVLGGYIVTDIFRDYQPPEDFTTKGGYIVVNGVRAGFTTPIKDGDVVEFIPYRTGTGNSGKPEA